MNVQASHSQAFVLSERSGPRDQAFSKEERQLLLKLPELLRTGALSSLIQFFGFSVVDNVQANRHRFFDQRSRHRSAKTSRGQVLKIYQYEL